MCNLKLLVIIQSMQQKVNYIYQPVSEMTYTVSSGTLNPTILHHTIYQHSVIVLNANFLVSSLLLIKSFF